MDFAANLRRICDKKGTNPTRVCIDLGLSTSKVSAWNKGTIPKKETLLRLAEHLDCAVMEFFADAEDIANGAIAKNDDEKELLRIYRNFDTRSKHKFMMYVFELEEAYHKAQEDAKQGVI